jgi:hypothetical protein
MPAVANHQWKHRMKPLIAVLATGSALVFAQAQAVQETTTQAPPDLDLEIVYYSKVITPEGVTRESRYGETMLRRPGHVWVSRVLPATLPTTAGDAHDDDAHGTKPVSIRQNAASQEQSHKHFNPGVLPRHVMQAKEGLRVEYIDAHSREVIAVPATEYDNVGFDGSWANSVYLLDPALVAAMPLAKRASAIAGAQWHERTSGSNYQRVLWDTKRQIPLQIESGDKAGTFYRRVDITPAARLRSTLPWHDQGDYARREYADFLD